MTCKEYQQAWIKAENGKEASSEIREHFIKCGFCQEFTYEQETLRAHVKKLAHSESAPHSLRLRVEENIRGRRPPLSLLDRRLWVGVAAAMALLALTLAGLHRYRSSSALSPNQLAQDFIADHLHNLPGREEIVSPSAPEVESWFAGRVDFSVQVPKVASAVLQDARVCDIAGRKAALLHYRQETDQRVVSLFVMPEPTSFEAERRPIEVWKSNQGLNSTLWCHRGLVYSLVAALDSHSLQQIAESIKRQAH
jgi:anti-sigma factor RsiW